MRPMLYLLQKLFVTTQIFVKQHNHKTQKYGITEIDTVFFCLLLSLQKVKSKRWKANWISVMGYGYMLWKLLPGCGGKVSSGSGTGSCYDEKLCCCRGVACWWVAVLVIARTTLRTAPITSPQSEEQRRRNIISGLCLRSRPVDPNVVRPLVP